MKRLCLAFYMLITAILLLSCSPAPPAKPTGTPPASISLAASTYLNNALDFIEGNSVMIKLKKVDWTTVRRASIKLANHAQTPTDTYPAIRYALQQLGDHHSFFLTPQQATLSSTGQGQGIGL